MKDALPVGIRVTRLAAAAVATILTQSLSAEAFVDLGIHSSRIEADFPGAAEKSTSTQSDLHVGAGLRRELSQGSIGARVELDDIDGDLLLTVRALDYRRHVSERFALTAFAGAARLDLATPAFGYYLGGGVQFKDLWPRWTLAVDVRVGDKIARDSLLPSDPPPTPEGRDDIFYDLRGVSVYLSWRF
jgi:hypothetical protein